MRLEQIRQLMEIARGSSISKAAEALHISQPALSASLRGLEEELGRELFKRTNKGMFLTGDGEKICREAGAVLSTMDGWYAAGEGPGGLAGEVHLACNSTIGHYLTPNVVVPFQELNPGTTIFVSTVHHYGLLDALKSTRANMAIATLASGSHLLEEARGAGLECVPLFTDERRLYIGAAHPLAGKSMITRDDLSTLPLAWYSYGKDLVSRMYAPYFRSSFRLANKEDILDLVVAGEAAFIQPCSLFRHDFRVRDHLVVEKRMPPLDLDPRAAIVALFRTGLSRREQVFRDYLLEHFTDALEAGPHEA